VIERNTKTATNANQARSNSLGLSRARRPDSGSHPTVPACCEK
jgi:hypothetical protein